MGLKFALWGDFKCLRRSDFIWLTTWRLPLDQHKIARDASSEPEVQGKRKRFSTQNNSIFHYYADGAHEDELDYEADEEEWNKPFFDMIVFFKGWILKWT